MFVFDKIPFVDQDHDSFSVFLSQSEDVHILRFPTLRGIYHQDHNIRIFDRTDRSHYGIEFQILGNFRFTTHSGCVYQHKLVSEFVV
ncbi:hypothetical protein D3C72_1958150 [compost metagenome]